MRIFLQLTFFFIFFLSNERNITAGNTCGYYKYIFPIEIFKYRFSNCSTTVIIISYYIITQYNIISIIVYNVIVFF